MVATGRAGIQVPSPSLGISPAGSDASNAAQLRLCGAYAPTTLRMTSFEMVWNRAFAKSAKVGAPSVPED